MFIIWYTFYNKMAPEQAFYYSIQAGFSIGYGALTEDFLFGRWIWECSEQFPCTIQPQDGLGRTFNLFYVPPQLGGPPNHLNATLPRDGCHLYIANSSYVSGTTRFKGILLDWCRYVVGDKWIASEIMTILNILLGAVVAAQILGQVFGLILDASVDWKKEVEAEIVQSVIAESVKETKRHKTKRKCIWCCSPLSTELVSNNTVIVIGDRAIQKRRNEGKVMQNAQENAAVNTKTCLCWSVLL